MFPREAQEAVWGEDQDTLIASAFAFKTGQGRPVDGGYYVEGDWEFSSGSDACTWIILGTPIFEDGAERPSRVVWCLLPKIDWEILDTWYAAGLKGTGTNNVRVQGTFVPTELTLEVGQCDGRPTPGSAVNPSNMYRLPLRPIFPFNISTPALGIAKGVIEAYVAYLGSRPDRANMVQRQLRVAESMAEVDAAVALLRANAAEISRAIHTGEPLSANFLAKSSRDTSFAVQLCVRAVDRLANAVGAHGMLEDTDIQRGFRDVHAIANHAANSFDVMGVVYARHVLGLPPVSAF
jgi:3-hydroxy-9,10-secoandrosta-1,3,5(10)-triene-9,17-dione monooxygenase